MYSILVSISILFIGIAFLLIFKNLKYNIGYLVGAVIILAASYLLLTGSSSSLVVTNTTNSNIYPISNTIYQSNTTNMYIYLYNSSQYSFYLGNTISNLKEVSSCSSVTSNCENVFIIPQTYFYKLINSNGVMYTVYENISVNLSE